MALEALHKMRRFRQEESKRLEVEFQAAEAQEGGIVKLGVPCEAHNAAGPSATLIRVEKNSGVGNIEECFF
jgi:hypothetical protein